MKRTTRMALSALALVALGGFVLLSALQIRWTDLHGTGFVGTELVDGDVYRTSALYGSMAMLSLAATMTMWYALLRTNVANVGRVRPFIIGAASLGIAASAMLLLSMRSNKPPDVAFLILGGYLLISVAGFRIGQLLERSGGASRALTWTLMSLPVVVVTAILARNTGVETFAVALIVAVCAGVSLRLASYPVRMTLR